MIARMSNLLRQTSLILFSILMAACAPTPDSASTGTPSPGPQPVFAFATATPAPTPSPTPRATPTDQVNCADSALFIADVTIPDNTKFEPGVAFTKTWKLKNTGTCTWNERYSLVFANGQQMDGPVSLSLSETRPAEMLDISVDFIAPSNSGIFTAAYRLQTPDGKLIQVGLTETIYVKIQVGTVATNNGAVSVPGGLSTPPSPTSTSGGGGMAGCQSSENGAYLNQLLALINAARAEANASPLNLNSALSAAAQGHSLDMACNNFLTHNGSDGSSIGDRIAAAGYLADDYTEIIAIGTPQDAMSQWRASASHWDALIDKSMTECGIGYVYVANSDYGGYFTVDLATP